MATSSSYETTPDPDVASVTRELPFGPAHRSNPVLALKEGFWRPFFVRPKKILLIKRRGKSIKQKFLEMVQVTDLFHNDEFIFVWSLKNGNG